ncbi:spermidine/putrescine ABC transporter ATP-binding subunit [Sphaerochaeta pleomorpha str. Grapes]|uniref:Spermidine/putrescine import ATP-binding protein PotA n=1 Tax=Sphaerochaeta pleomorpha (strain ATCC BAA-1885 / DSM 22778 / Grapes) TaxID=158190 RepID=G8QSH3_SPHPG|nr:ABC transporter ATP-binding protein [Sphaerochaeta pleomorpha]AEV27872.1 spermidine/putrescine ABC transporter ATP-binding subunit [Sphaerochaeta pleomorpha str. Grapes]
MKGVEVTVGQVSRAYGDFKALDDVSVQIKKGEFFSLLGPSGCGKTTLLRIIAGFDYPDNGTVEFDGKNILPLAPDKRQSNTVFQTYALFPHLTVYENIAFPLRLKHVDKNEIDRKVKEYVHLVQLDDHIHKKPSMLSGGQKQRVAIARALINEPRVLLLDEPLSALDAKLRQNLLVELDELHDKVGITFIYVTHDQSEALSVSDRIAVMNKGKVLQIGTPYEIYEAPATRFVAQFIGESNSFPCTVLSCEPFNSEYMLKVDVPALGGIVSVTDYDSQPIGAKIDFTVRPEKIRITAEAPKATNKELNIYCGMVDEPVYSGFQSKFYVRLDNEKHSIIKVFKQHTAFLDEGPEISWRDKVFVSWTAADGYLVKVVDR